MPLAAAERGPESRLTTGLVDCQSHLRSIYLDIVSPLAEAMRFALDFSGADTLLFSSDHPWVQPREILAPLRSLHLSVQHETLILRANARRLFQL